MSAALNLRWRPGKTPNRRRAVMADLLGPSLFDEDYLHFYETILTPERSDEETEVALGLGGLQPGMAVLDAPCGHGRIANRLAGHGIRVTGLDASGLFLDVA